MLENMSYEKCRIKFHRTKYKKTSKINFIYNVYVTPFFMWQHKEFYLYIYLHQLSMIYDPFIDWSKPFAT